MEGDIFTEVEVQAARLGLPADFYRRLILEDDWSFAIKLNALVEAACSDALAARLHAPELSTCLASLDLGHSKHGKVALLRALGVLEKEQASVLQTLYEIRNTLAHNICQVNFTFESYLDGLEQKKKTNFVQRAGYGLQPKIKGVARDSFVLENPKLALWFTVMEILACLHLEHDAAEVRLNTLAVEKLKGALNLPRDG